MVNALERETVNPHESPSFCNKKVIVEPFPPLFYTTARPTFRSQTCQNHQSCAIHTIIIKAIINHVLFT